jgi:hypothetical protein
MLCRCSLVLSLYIEVTEDERDLLMNSGITYDQVIAIPVEGNFFLRAGAQEMESDRVGALEVPAEWMTPATAQAAAAAPMA